MRKGQIKVLRSGFLCNLGAAGENFGINRSKNRKEAFKKVKDSQKKVTKTADISTLNGKV